MRTGIKPLTERNGEFVVDPALRRVPLPGVAILGRNIGGCCYMGEILQSPGIGFADWHDLKVTEPDDER